MGGGAFGRASEPRFSSKDPAPFGGPSADGQWVAHAARAAASAAFPWLLLALIFYVPGVYLEWPADPWEHLRRILEWRSQDLVGFHSAGYKTQYFLIYSFVGRCSPSNLLFWVNAYYTSVCLLLAWQYYRLGRAAGLKDRWAFLFVVVNVLTFGNACFGFYRYYGLATTMFMQIGVVALTRITFEIGQGRAAVSSWSDDSETNSIVARYDGFIGRFLCSAGARLASGLLLLALIGFSHVQGLGIVALSLGALVIWRLIEWRRSMAIYLAVAVIVLSLVVVKWLPKHPWLDTSYRPEGWLTSWYAFNILTWPSPAADRALQILGVFGLINMGAGLLLLRRNSAVGWLTVGPALALCLPVVAVPLAEIFAENSEPILAFQRLLFAIPSGLAVVVAFASRSSDLMPNDGNGSAVAVDYRWCGVLGGVVLLAGLALLPPDGICYNRFWNVLSRQSGNLELEAAIKVSAALQDNSVVFADRVIASPGVSFVLNATGTKIPVDTGSRVIRFEAPPSGRVDEMVRQLENGGDARPTTMVVLPRITALSNGFSLAGYLSKHWLPSEVPLQFVGNLEIAEIAKKNGFREMSLQDADIYIYEQILARITEPCDKAAHVSTHSRFQWSKAPRAKAYYLYVGTRTGAKDVIDTGELLPSVTLYTSASLPPGRTLFATLFTKLGDVWMSTSTTFDTSRTDN